MVIVQIGNPKQSIDDTVIVHQYLFFFLLCFFSANQKYAVASKLPQLLRRIALKLLLVVMGLFLGTQPILAQDIFSKPIEINAQFSERKIGQNLWILEDPKRQWDFDQVRAPEIAAKFVASSKDSPSFGYTQSAYWAYFRLNDLGTVNDAQHGEVHAKHASNDLVLLLAYAHTDVAELWCTNAAGATILHQRAGDHVPRSEWPTSYREPAFQITTGAQECWLRVQSSASMQFPLTLYTVNAFIDKRLTDNAQQALYFGALLVMLIYNGLIAFFTRTSAYISYTAFLLTFGLFQFTFGGLGYALLWPDTIGVGDELAPFFVACIGINSLLFTSHLLDLRKTAPRWFKYCLVLVILFSLSFFTIWLLPYETVVIYLTFLALFWVVALLGSGFYLALRGVRLAKIFLAAWLVLILGPLLFVGINYGWVPSNAFTVNAFQIGSAIEFILLSFALAERIKTLQEQLVTSIKAETLAKTEAALAQQKAMEELDRMKDQFIATVSHELRTPIHGLTHMTEVLLRSPDLPASLQKPLHAWTDASARLSQLVGNIIDFSDMQQGQLRVSLQDVDPLPLLQQQIDAAQLALKGKPITVRSRLPSDVALLHADPLRVVQILDQIVGNAIKFTKAGEIEIICQRARNKTPDMVEIIVTDTGNGMSSEQLATITRTFAQGDASDKRLTGGTGLGLSLTHRLAHAMGGSLYIESTPGIGTIVRVSLPASSTPRSVPELITGTAPANEANSAADSQTQTAHADQTAAPEQRRASDPVTAPSASTPPLALIGQSIALSTSDGPPRVLIVDDDPTNRMVLREQLSSQGYELADAVDGIDGLEKFQTEGPFDCVLLDVMMPRMNGLDACKQLRLSYSKTDLPVFMLSAKVQTKDIVAGFDAGANDYLPKPFSKTELLARLDTHIGVARTGRAMGRFVPRPFMELLGRQHVTEVALGDSVQMPMAVLFSDFRGFTAVAEGKTAPQLFALLNQFYTQIAPLVRWHGGFVDKYVGDGMMALFPGGAQDALAAAQAMVQAVQTISTEHGMAMGMGIHCGTTMLGTLGEPQRFDTTVISDVVNSASRLEGASKQLGADIVVSQAVLDAVSTDTPLQIRRLGKLRLKGKQDVLEVVEVLTALENSVHRQAKWQQRAVFEQAVQDCAEGRYAQARVSLGQLCKQCPTDLAAQLYLQAAIQADEGQAALVFDRGALILKEK